MMQEYNDCSVPQEELLEGMKLSLQSIIASGKQILDYLGQMEATEPEILDYAAKLLDGHRTLQEYGDYYFGGQAEGLELDYLTAKRASRLSRHLGRQPWMTGSDVAGICFCLQKYVDSVKPGPSEYKMFLEWLQTGPVHGEHGLYRFSKFFDHPENPGKASEIVVKMK